MLKGGSGEKETAFLQVFEHLFVRVLAEHAGPEGLFRHFSLAVHQLDKGKIIAAAHFGVVLTEGRGDMNHAGAVGQGNVTVAGDVPALFFRLYKIEQRLVFQMLQLAAGFGLQHGVILAENRPGKVFGKDVGFLAAADLHIVLVRIDAERDVGGKGPRRGGPREDIRVLILYLKFGDGGAFLYVLIALRDLVAGKRGAAAGAVGNDFEALVQQAFFPDLLERPPLRFDKVVVIGDIRVLHIGPEADGLGEILPHALVFPHAFLALFDERLQPVGLDLILAVDVQELFDLQLDREAVGVPTGLPGNHIAFHRPVAGDHVLDDTGEDMPDMGFAVRGGGAVVEGIGWAALPVLHALFKNVAFPPKLLGFLFPLHKIQVGRDLFIQRQNPSTPF